MYNEVQGCRYGLLHVADDYKIGGVQSIQGSIHC